MADACFSSSLDNFGLVAYFLVCNHHQKIGRHMLTTEIDRLCRPVCTNRSNRSRWLCQNINWTSPLRSSHRDDRNAYVERLIWSSDERVMVSGRLDTGLDRSNRSRRGSPTRIQRTPTREGPHQGRRALGCPRLGRPDRASSNAMETKKEWHIKVRKVG